MGLWENFLFVYRTKTEHEEPWLIKYFQNCEGMFSSAKVSYK